MYNNVSIRDPVSHIHIPSVTGTNYQAGTSYDYSPHLSLRLKNTKYMYTCTCVFLLVRRNGFSLKE